jgi:hypothetical protein
MRSKLPVEDMRRVAWRAGLRAGARGGQWWDAWEHGAKLARAYAKRYATSRSEYARMVLGYGSIFLDSAANVWPDLPRDEFWAKHW